MTNVIDQVKLQNMFPKTIGLFFGDWKLKREVSDHTTHKKWSKNDSDPKDDAYEMHVLVYGR
jgi:hypothetical protein